MGFSPGDFQTRDGKRYHFELKEGPRVVLWDEGEKTVVLDLDMENVRKIIDDLETIEDTEDNEGGDNEAHRQ